MLDDAQVEAVLFGETGVLAAAKPGTLVAIHSTVLPRTLKAIVEKAAAKDIIVVDAPISGGQTGVSRLADHWFERIERVAQSPQALRHQWEGLYKTLSVALESANDLSISLPGTALTQQLLAKIVGYKEVQ